MEPTPTRPRALVTGGTGFIGSHLCEAFLNDGSEVYAPADVIKHLRAAGTAAGEEPQREEARSGASTASAARTASE